MVAIVEKRDCYTTDEIRKLPEFDDNLWLLYEDYKDILDKYKELREAVKDYATLLQEASK